MLLYLFLLHISNGPLIDVSLCQFIRIMFPKQLIAMKIGHERFMNELEERLNNFAWQGVLGDVFTKLGNSYHVSFLKSFINILLSVIFLITLRNAL